MKRFFTLQVAVGIDEGLKHDSGIHCDELISLPKSMLTDYVGKLPPEKLHLLQRTLKIALPPEPLRSFLRPNYRYVFMRH